MTVSQLRIARADTAAVANYLESYFYGHRFSSYIQRSAVLLAGSVGWGIKDSTTPGADWDIHIIMDDADYSDWVSAIGAQFVIDDSARVPKVFGQVHSTSWLRDRLCSNDRKWWPLYLWISENGTWVRGSGAVDAQITAARNRFTSDRQELIRDHWVTFCVRKLDMKTSSANCQMLSERIYLSESITAALQAYSLVVSGPYPYIKWLPYWVTSLDGGAEIVSLAELATQTVDDSRKPLLRTLEGKLAGAITSRFGEQPWTGEWWKFLSN